MNTSNTDLKVARQLLRTYYQLLISGTVLCTVDSFRAKRRFFSTHYNTVIEAELRLAFAFTATEKIKVKVWRVVFDNYGSIVNRRFLHTGDPSQGAN